MYRAEPARRFLSWGGEFGMKCSSLHISIEGKGHIII